MPEDFVELHPLALEEAAEAARWYRERSERAEAGFIAELDRAISLIGDAPERWPRYLHGTRRFMLRRYPFAVVYREAERRIEVIAVAHSKRRPAYWRGR